jgi:hypothetical protein
MVPPATTPAPDAAGEAALLVEAGALAAVAAGVPGVEADPPPPPQATTVRPRRRGRREVRRMVGTKRIPRSN